jgi:hypothetical protein
VDLHSFGLSSPVDLVLKNRAGIVLYYFGWFPIPPFSRYMKQFKRIKILLQIGFTSADLFTEKGASPAI